MLNLRIPQFLGNFLKIFSGTLITQILSFICLPFLARAYSPQDFGNLGLAVSASSLLGIAAALKYELSVMIPENDDEAVSTLTLSLVLPFAVLPVFLPVIFLLNQFTHLSLLILFFIPCVALANIHLSTITLWYQRQKKFAASSILNVLRISTVLILQLLLQSHRDGLLIGHLSASIVLSFSCLGFLLFTQRNLFLNVTSKTLFHCMIRYQKFPLFTLPAAFINAVGSELPVFLFGAYFGTENLGIFNMLQKILLSPVRLISESLNSLIFQNFTAKLARRVSVLSDLIKVLLLMIPSSLFFCLLIFAISKSSLLTFFLGARFSAVNDFVTAFLPLAGAALVSRSISNFGPIFQRQELGLCFQIFFSLMSGGSIIASYSAGFDFWTCLLCYSCSMATAYLISSLITFLLALEKDRQFRNSV